MKKIILVTVTLLAAIILMSCSKGKKYDLEIKANESLIELVHQKEVLNTSYGFQIYELKTGKKTIKKTFKLDNGERLTIIFTNSFNISGAEYVFNEIQLLEDISGEEEIKQKEIKVHTRSLQVVASKTENDMYFELSQHYREQIYYPYFFYIVINFKRMANENI